MNERTRIAASSLLSALLGGWLGSIALFALVVAPTAFRILPTTDLAGRMVGPVLGAIHLYGGGAGIAVGLLSLLLQRGRSLAALSLFLAGVSLLSHFGVSATIAELQTSAPPGGLDGEAAARFAQLHGLSVTLFSALGLGTLALVILQSRAQERSASLPPTAP